MGVVIRQKIKRPKAGYNEERNIQLLDNTKIFKRISGFDRSDESIYIWCDKTKPCNIYLGWGIYLKFQPVYIGMGTAFGNPINWRAFNHSNDLLETTLNKYPNRYMCHIPVVATSKENAKALEAYIIWSLIHEHNYILSKQGQKTYNCNNIKTLINKRRERAYERDAIKFLNFENQWK